VVRTAHIMLFMFASREDAALRSALIAYEALRYAEVRDRVRHQPVR
jgi:hypothetical protein